MKMTYSVPYQMIRIRGSDEDYKENGQQRCIVATELAYEGDSTTSTYVTTTSKSYSNDIHLTRTIGQ